MRIDLLLFAAFIALSGGSFMREDGLSNPEYVASLKELSDLSRITSISPVSDTCARSVFSTTTLYFGELYWMCISKAEAPSGAVVALGLVEGATAKWRALQSKRFKSATSLTAFVPPSNDHQRLYFVVASPDSDEETPLLFYDKQNIFVEYKFPERQLLHVTSWTSGATGKIHLALAPKVGPVVVYSWEDDSHMDKSSSIDGCENAIHLEAFSNAGVDFIACTSISGVVELFRYELSHSRWHSHQMVPSTPATVATHFFRNAKSNYLAILNHFNRAGSNPAGTDTASQMSIVYKQSGSSEGFRFSAFQNLDVRGAMSASSYHHTQNWGVFLLAVASETEGIVLFEFDGWRLERSLRLSNDALRRSGARHVHIFHDSKANIHLAFSNPRHFGPGVFSLTVDSFPEEKRWYAESLQWCQGELNSNTVKKAVGIQQRLSDFVLIDSRPQSPVVIEGRLEAPVGLEVESLRAEEINDNEKGHRYVAHSLRELPHVKRSIQRAQSELNAITNILHQTVKIVGNNIITAPLFVDQLHVDSGKIGSLFSSRLNGRQIDGFSNKLFFKNVTQSVPGNLRIRRIESKIVTTKFINGIQPHLFVTRNTDQVFSGETRFMSRIHASDLVSGASINNIKFAPDSILMNHGDQTLAGDFTIHAAEIKKLRSENSVIAGVHLTKLMRSAVTKTVPSVLFGEGTKHFRRLEVLGVLEMDETSPLNGVPLKRVFSFVDINRPQSIIAPMVFLDAAFNEIITPHVNGLRIPGPDVVYTNLPNGFISALKNFERPISTSGLNFSRSFNGQRLLEDQKLDVFLKSAAQQVSAPMSFDSVHLASDSALKGTINGYTFGDILGHKLDHQSRDQLSVDGDVTFAQPLGAISVNGVNLADLFRRGMPLSAPQLTASAVKFSGLVTLTKLNAGLVNQASIPGQFLERRITKRNTRLDALVFDDLVLHEAKLSGVKDFSGVDLQVLKSDTLFRHAPQIQRVLGPKRFVNASWATFVEAKTINGISLSNLCHLEDGCRLQAPKTLRKLIANAAHFNQLEAVRIGNVDVNDFLHNALLFSKPQEFVGRFRVETAALSENGLRTSTVSGVDIPVLLRHGIRLDSSVIMKSPVSFSQPVLAKRVDRFHSISGVSQEDFLGWMVNGIAQTVRPQAELRVFARLEARSGLRIAASWNDFNFDQLVNSSINLSEPVTFSQRMSFQDVLIDNSLDTERIQGLRPDDFALIDDHRLITGPKRFERTLAAASLEVGSPIASVDLPKLVDSVLWRSGGDHGFTDKLDLHVTGDVVIRDLQRALEGAKICDVDIHRSWTQCRSKDYSRDLPRKVNRLIVKGPIKTPSLNSVPSWRLRGYVSKSSPGNLPSLTPDSELTFEGETHLTQLMCGRINGRNLAEHFRSSLNSNKHQSIITEIQVDEIMFNGPVTLRGKLNGLSIPNDVFSTRDKVINLPALEANNLRIVNVHNEQLHISDSPVHRFLSSNASAFPHGSIYDVDATRLRSSVKRGTLPRLRVDQLEVIGNINGKPVDLHHALVKTFPQTIRAETRLVGTAAIKKLNCGDIKLEMDGLQAKTFSGLMKTALRQSRENVVSGPVTLKAPLNARSVRSLVTIDSRMIEATKYLSRRASELSQSLQSSIAALKRLERDVQLRDQGVPYFYDEILSTADSKDLIWAHQASSDGDWFFAVKSSPASGTGRLGIVGPRHRGPLNLNLPVSAGIESVLASEFAGHIFLVTVSPNSKSECSTSSEMCAESGEVNVLKLDRASRTLRQEMLLRTTADSAITAFVDDRMCVVLTGKAGIQWTCVDPYGRWSTLHSPLLGKKVAASNSTSRATGSLDIQRCAGTTLASVVEDRAMALYALESLENWKEVARLPMEASQVAIVPLENKCLVIATRKRRTLPLVMLRVDRHRQVEQVQRLLIEDSVKRVDVVRVSDHRSLLMLSASPRLHVVQLDTLQERMHIVGEFNFETDGDLRAFASAKRGHYVTAGGTILYSE